MKVHLFLVCFWILHSGFATGMKQNRSRHEKIASDNQKNTVVNKSTLPAEKIFLRINTPMKNQTATSGEKIQFKCKVGGWPSKNIHYTWFKDDALIDMTQDPRVTIATRPWGSKLRIKDVFTLDTGTYRCEASNEYRRVATIAYLKVNFERPPPPSKHEKSQINFPSGKCEKYSGLVCGDFLNGVRIFVDSFENQEEMENQIKQALTQISNATFSSDACRKYTLPAFCHFVFTPCHVEKKGVIKRGNRLCREDCQLLKHDVCHDEFSKRNKNSFLETLFNSANCSHLPSSKDSDCVRIGVKDSTADQECCHNDGEDYRGTANVAETGENCKVWPLHMAAKHSELLGGHNFCRNPGNLMGKPWCFVDDVKTKIVCNVRKCEKSNRMSRNLIIMIISTSSFVLLIFGVVFCCIQSSRQKQICNSTSFTRKTNENQSNVALLPNQKQTTLSRINSTSVKLLVEIGIGEYGKIYKGTISNDPRFYEKQPFAFKVFESSHVTSNLETFEQDVEALSKLCNPYITNLKALAIDQNIKILAFEYTNQVNLHEHLLLNSPTSDFAKTQGYLSNEATKLSTESFLKMALQISTGLEYLSSKHYIHRDLAARNVLVCGNSNLKISNLGMVKDSYLSSYYKTSNGQLLPIRWMAPESLQSWQFSEKSTVWSFGVLLWEIFSYGMQPYCGYSNHEVLDVISRYQLLSCPDQCPAKIYSLMRDCWEVQPSQRPSFTDIRNRMETFQCDNNNLLVNTLPHPKDVNTMKPPRYHAEKVPSTWERSSSFSEKTLLL